MHYTGSRHCGRIAYSLDAGEGLGEVYDCNCSMCRRRGGLLAFFPREALELTTDPGDLGTYRFNRRQLQHHFCATCGIAPFSEGTDPQGNPTVAVNVRCLDGVDPGALTVVQVNGAEF